MEKPILLLWIAIGLLVALGVGMALSFYSFTEQTLAPSYPVLARAIKSMFEYRWEFRRLIKTLGLGNFVEPIDESDLLAKTGTAFSSFTDRVRHAAVVFMQYWKQLHERNVEDHDQLPAFRAAKELGLRGPVPKTQWRHYTDRVRTEYPDMPLEERAVQAARYLATAVTRAGVRSIHGETEDKKGTIPPIKASFVPYPPGTPASMFMGRVEYKVKDSKTSRKSIPPWAGFGFMRARDAGCYDFTAAGVTDLRSGIECDPVTVTIKREGREAKFRADVVAT